MNVGPVTRATASAYDRSRVHGATLFPTETRRLVVDFNGILPEGELVISAAFQQEVVCSVAMADAQIAEDQRSTSCLVTAAYRGTAVIRCQVTTDDGNKFNQLVHFTVLSGPWFGDENTAAGPSTLTVSV